MTDGADRTAIRLDQFLRHPPASVWSALTDPVKLARWLMPNDFCLSLGHRFTFRTDPVPAAGFDGIVQCEVLAFEPERMLRISWSAAGIMSTTVTWRLTPEGTGTRLFLDHEGFDPDNPAQQATRQILDGGWRSGIMRALEAVLTDSP